MLGQEAYLDWHLEETNFQFLGDVSKIQDSLAVFFGCGHHGGWILTYGIHYPADVVFGVLVMVLEAEAFDDFVLIAEVHAQRGVLCDSGEEDEFL